MLAGLLVVLNCALFFTCGPNNHFRFKYEWIQFVGFHLLCLGLTAGRYSLGLKIARSTYDKGVRAIGSLGCASIALGCIGMSLLHAFVNLEMISPRGLHRHVGSVVSNGEILQVYEQPGCILGGALFYRYFEEKTVFPGLSWVREIDQEHLPAGVEYRPEGTKTNAL